MQPPIRIKALSIPETLMIISKTLLVFLDLFQRIKMVMPPNTRHYQDYRITPHDIQFRTKHHDEESIKLHRHDSYPLIFNPSVQTTVHAHL